MNKQYTRCLSMSSISLTGRGSGYRRNNSPLWEWFRVTEFPELKGDVWDSDAEITVNLMMPVVLAGPKHAIIYCPIF